MRKMFAALAATLMVGSASALPAPDCQSRKDDYFVATQSHLSARETIRDELDLLTDALRSYREVNRSMPRDEYRSMASDTLDASLDSDLFDLEAILAASRYIVCLRGRS